LDDLRKRTRDVERYGTKRVAHFDEKDPKNIQTFQELDDALGLIHELRVKYLLLLWAVTHLEPVWTYDWKAIFREPWVSRLWSAGEETQPHTLRAALRERAAPEQMLVTKHDSMRLKTPFSRVLAPANINSPPVSTLSVHT
jgi:hypothetical protein